MTPEMIEAAENLENAARRYRRLYEEQHGCKPVVWVRRDDDGTAVFISDSFNAKLILRSLDEPPYIIDGPNII